MPEMRPCKDSWSHKTSVGSDQNVGVDCGKLKDSPDSSRGSPTCWGCPALGSGYPGASCQLVLQQLLVEAIFRRVATHQEQRQASTGS